MYYILQKGENRKQRYAVKAPSRGQAHKKVAHLCGGGAWDYISMTDSVEGIGKYQAVLVGDSK